MSQTRVYDVPAISCGHCKDAIESAVGALDGVDRVEVAIDERSVTVEGDAPDTAVDAAIEEAGYEVAGTR